MLATSFVAAALIASALVFFYVYRALNRLGAPKASPSTPAQAPHLVLAKPSNTAEAAGSITLLQAQRRVAPYLGIAPLVGPRTPNEGSALPFIQIEPSQLPAAGGVAGEDADEPVAAT